MSVLAPTRKFTVEEYHKLADIGLIGEDDRIELLNGELVVKHAIGKRHSQAVTNLNMDFADHARRRFMVSPQNPVWLDEMSEPEPDLVLVPWRRKAGESLPTPDDVFLIIEVANSSLRYDRRDKLRAYARVGIREFWIFNLDEDVMEVFRDPAGEDYNCRLRLGAGESLAPLAFPEAVIALDEIIP